MLMGKQNQSVNLANALAEKVLNLWNTKAPSPFVAGNRLWPSLDVVSEELSTALRQCGVNPLQDSKAMSSDITVDVLHAAPRFKGNCNGLFLAVLFWFIGILKIKKPFGVVRVCFPLKGNYFTVEFYN
jgi:hypothetical protein